MYFEHPMYVPLLQRAYEMWNELGHMTDSTLLHMNGGLMIGPKEGKLVTGTLRSAREHGLAREILTPHETSKRFPAFELRDDYVAVYDPRAGYLDPEACNAAHHRIARDNGAELRFDEPVLSWSEDADGVNVTTGRGTYTADHLVLSVGARTLQLLTGPEARLELPLNVERQAVFWFEPDAFSASYDEKVFPIFAHEYIAGEICYGFPRLRRGVKASVMHNGEVVAEADAVRRAVGDEEVAPLRGALRNILPRLSNAPVRESDICLFTNTPDHDFIIDFHPRHPRVIVSSACSGHGFKFASVIGEIQADLVMNGKSKFDLTPFSITRFEVA